MRGKKTVLNTATSLLKELVVVICGFILPRLILTTFGSKYNGLTSSITQFLSCSVLLRAGIGGATRAALYEPLAKKNKEDISAIMKATDIFMKKIGLILGAAIVIFAVIYPIFVNDEFEWGFTFSLFLIIGASTFAESFWGTTYLTLLQADQKLWISSLISSVCYILNTVVAAILICFVDSIHIVKLGSAVIYVLYPIVLSWYVKKTYEIDLNVEPNNTAISQRWDAFWHQAATFIMSNVGVIVLTFFSEIVEVSVYSVYTLVVNGLKKVIFSFSNGLEAAFGNMIANKEHSALKKNFSLMEWVIYTISTIVCTCAIILILPFVRIYTSGVTDVNYIRPLFAYIMLCSLFFNCVRIPYQLVVQAVGHYKQTKNGAILESVINIVLSTAFVIKYGLVGVAIGTLVATVFRTIQYSNYICKIVEDRTMLATVHRILIAFSEAIITILLVNMLHLPQPANYLGWVVNGFITFVICCSIVLSGSLLFDRKNVNYFTSKIKSIIKKK